ncbi:hypothetical protein, partial [Lacticaseibacillus rhamnosus]
FNYERRANLSFPVQIYYQHQEYGGLVEQPLVKTMFLIRVNFYEGFTRHCLFLFIQTVLESWFEGVLDLKVKEIGKKFFIKRLH